MIEEIKTLIANYQAWLHDKTKLRQLDDWVEITTPYLDRHNDYLQIYVKPQNGEFTLTDDGYILEDLKFSGCTLDSPKRQALLRTILNGFGITLNEGALEVSTSANNFPLHKHNLIQAMLAVNDLFNLARSTVANLFYEDVEEWLDKSQIRYVTNLKFTGFSKLEHHFDFVIAKSSEQPERILQPINHPDRNAAEKLAFAWQDTREVRPANTKAYALLNDSERAVSPNIIKALTNYDIEPVLWSNREIIKEKLAA